MTKSEDIIEMNVLVTDDMYPIPPGVKVQESVGFKLILDTDDDGALQGGILAKGYQMVLLGPVLDLALWAKQHSPVWIWDGEVKKFKQIVLEGNND